ncbi:MAG: diguanylate cyclase domain-containing protein [Gammaproteobacteria bacterium]
MDDRRWIPYLARVFALAGLYFAGAKLGQAFSLACGRPRIPWSRARATEVIALMLTLVLVCGVVFGDWFFQGRYFIPAFVVFPLLLWAPLRLGLCCTAVVTLLVCGAAAWGTARGMGPLGRGSPLENLILLWLFANIVVATGLILAAVTAQRKQAEERIQELALHDPLTGLANRTLLGARFNEVLARSHRYGGHAALLYLDLDRFKPVNDTLGHQAGDEVLIEAAKRIDACVREVDTIARVGGDEFVIVLQDVASEAAAESVASKIIAALDRPFRVLGWEWTIGGSIGIAIYPRNGADLERLIANADIALYRAKQSGGNTYRIYYDVP